MDNRANPSTINTNINLPFTLMPIHDSTVVEDGTKCENGIESSSGSASKKNSGEGSRHSDQSSKKDGDTKKKKFNIFKKKSAPATSEGQMEIGQPELVDHKGVSKGHLDGQDPAKVSEMIMKMMTGEKFLTTVKSTRYTTDDELDDSSLTSSTGSLDKTRDTTSNSETSRATMNISEPSSVLKTPMVVPVQPTSDEYSLTPGPPSPEHKAETKEKPQVTPNYVVNKPQKPARSTVTKRMTEEDMVEKLKELVGDDDAEKRFINRQIIGSGASAKVYCCQDTRNENLVAMKVLSLKEQKKREYVVSEIRVMKKINHKNIVNLIDCFLTIEKRFLMIVMEYLWHALTNVILEMDDLMEEQYIAFNAHEILLGLDYLHGSNIIHRDIKSDNVLLGLDGAVKLADFGFCAELANSDSQRKTQLGTPYWMCPEIARREQYSANVDVWSLGILVIEMIDTSPPYMDDEFYARNPLQAIQEIAKLTEPPEIKRVNLISNSLTSFVRDSLTINASKRPDAATMLQHPFLRSRCTQNSFARFIKKLDLDEKESEWK